MGNKAVLMQRWLCRQNTPWFGWSPPNTRSQCQRLRLLNLKQNELLWWPECSSSKTLRQLLQQLLQKPHAMQLRRKL